MRAPNTDETADKLIAIMLALASASYSLAKYGRWTETAFADFRANEREIHAKLMPAVTAALGDMVSMLEMMEVAGEGEGE